MPISDTPIPRLHRWSFTRHYSAHATPHYQVVWAAVVSRQYLIRSGAGVDLACQLFGAAAWQCAPRDRWIGWSAEHRVEVKECPCCQRTLAAAFPADIKAPVQYGKNLRALLAYFYDAQEGASLRIREMCAEMFGYAVSEGTLQAARQEQHQALEPFEERLRQILLYSCELIRGASGGVIRGVTGWMIEFGCGEKGAVAWGEGFDGVCGRPLEIGPGDGNALVRGGGVGIGRRRYIPCSARNWASNCSARWRPASCCSGVGGGDPSGGGGGVGLGAWS